MSKGYNQNLLKNHLSKININKFTLKNKCINWPKISLITPSFNQGQYLERTIISVINQNYPNLEYMIFDGKSKDKSNKIIKKYESYLSYWECKNDKGQSSAILKGFKKASGEIFAWLNSDDVYWPGALLVVGQYFDEHPEIDVIYGNSFTIDKNDNILRETRSVKYSKRGLKTLSFSMHQASIFWRSSIYKKVDGIRNDLNFIMDTDLWFQFLLIGAKFKHIRNTLSCYRTHNLTKAMKYENEVNITRKKIYKERLRIDCNTINFKIERNIMRFRTLILHLFNGNLFYLIKNAGKKA